MRKYSLLLIFVLYFFCFDGDGYIIDLTRINPSRPNYEAHDIDPANIPLDVLRGYYKLENGQFALDETRKAQWIAANEEETPEE